MRQPLAAVFGVAAERGPASLDELFVGFLETGRRGHAAIVATLAALAVADLIQWV